MESESDYVRIRPTPSRLWVILAILVCTVVPTWLLVAALRASPEPLSLPLSIAFTVSIVRGITVAARWFVLGPGRPSDRAIWGFFFVAMFALAPLAALGESWRFGASMLIPYFAVQSIYWRIAGFTGEREGFVGESREKSRFGLQDALVVLALFCIVAAAVRAQAELRTSYASSEIVFVFLASFAVLPFVGLAPILCDLGVRAAIRSRSSRGRRTGVAVAAVPTILAIVCLLGVSIDRWDTDFIMTAFGFVFAYVVYAALQETVLALAGFIATDGSTPDEDEETRTLPTPLGGD